METRRRRLIQLENHQLLLLQQPVGLQ
jgi:hypothetical protein